MSTPGAEAAAGADDTIDDAVLRRFLLGLAEGLNAAMESVDRIRDIVHDVARAYGRHDTDFVVLPTVIVRRMPWGRRRGDRGRPGREQTPGEDAGNLGHRRFAGRLARSCRGAGRSANTLVG